jgi:hypothetical protein
MKTRRVKRGGAKMQPLKKKNTARHKPVNLFKKPTFGQANVISEQILMNVNVLPQKSAKKGSRPDSYLERVVKLLDKITDYDDSMTPEQEERQAFIANIIRIEIQPTIRDLNINIENVEEGEAFEYLDELKEYIEDLLEEYDEAKNPAEKFQIKTEMVYLAGSIEDAIDEAKRYTKSINVPKNNAAMNNLIGQLGSINIKKNGPKKNVEVDELMAMFAKMPAFK